MFPFLFVSISCYLFPLVGYTSFTQDILLYILGSINQLIALLVGIFLIIGEFIHEHFQKI